MRTFKIFIAIVCLTICSSHPARATYPFRPRKTINLAGYPFYPALLGIPSKEYKNIIVPGYFQRAAAIQLIVADLYDRQVLLKKFPHWNEILKHLPGYWPELVGLMKDKHFARFYGPDLVRSASGIYRTLEENGGNVGGSDFIATAQDVAINYPGFGKVPFNKDLYERWIGQLKALAKSEFGDRKPVIVFGDYSSPRTAPITVESGKKIAPPFFVSDQFIADFTKLLNDAGAEWAGLAVEPKDRRLIVEDGVLYYLPEKSKRKQKVDIFVSLTSVEAIDTQHSDQLKRNAEAGRDDLNDLAELISVPGIVSAWTKPKGEGFIWVNGPHSTFTRSKLVNLMVDEFILAGGLEQTPYDGTADQRLIIPTQETITFFDAEGKLNESIFKEIEKSHPVLKQSLGQSGKQVWIYPDDFKDPKISAHELYSHFLWNDFFNIAKENPFAVLAQPVFDLNQINVPGSGEWYSDLRQIGLISGVGADFRAVLDRMMMVRFSKNRKVNVSGGGWMSIAVPFKTTTPHFLKPLSSKNRNCVERLMKISDKY